MDLNEEGNRIKDDNGAENLNACNLPSQDGYLTMQNLILRDNIPTGFDENIQVSITNQIKSNDGYLTMQNLILRDNIPTGFDENIQVSITNQIKSNDQTIKFGLLIEHNMKNIFLEKSYTKCG